jgi:hypothetical protein
MSEQNRLRVKAFRDNKAASEGRAAYNLAESAKRKERRHRAKLALTPTPVPTPEPEPPTSVPPTPVNSPKVKKEDCSEFIEQIYNSKKAILEALPIPKIVTKSTVIQQFAKIQNMALKMGVADCTDLAFLKKTKKIVDYVNSNYNTPNSQNAQFQAISSILGALPEYKKQYTYYSKLSTKNRVAINEAAGDNLSSDAEKERFVPWDTLKKLHKKITDPRDKALIALYTLLPPRRVDDVSLLTLGGSVNELVMKDEQPTHIIYRKFKSDKSSPEIKIKLPAALSKILKAYIEEDKLQVGEPLFPNQNGDHYSNFSQYVSKIFAKHLGGKHISVNDLRHSYVTEFLSTTKSENQKKSLAKQMGNSNDSQSQYLRIDQVK